MLKFSDCKKYIPPAASTNCSYRHKANLSIFSLPSFPATLNRLKILPVMASESKMDIETAESQLKAMEHSEQHYFNR